MSATPDWTRANWRKSTKSGGGGGACVEYAELDGLHGVRDSKNRSGPVLAFTASEWIAFVGGVKDGEFDLT